MMSISPEQFARAVSDPTRLRILVLLVDQPELCVCELVAALRLPQPKISRHLATLRETGLLLDRRAGQWIHYRLHPELPEWALVAARALGEGARHLEPYQADRSFLDGSRDQASDLCAGAPGPLRVVLEGP